MAQSVLSLGLLTLGLVSSIKIGTPELAPQAGLDFECPLRQLAFEYAYKLLGGRGSENVATALDLKTKAQGRASTPLFNVTGQTWITCPGSNAVDDGSCKSPTAPCDPTSQSYNAGQLASLEDCENLCIASAANFSCRAVTWHDTTAGDWAKVCILQELGVYAPVKQAGYTAACTPGPDFPKCTKSCQPPPAPSPAPPTEACSIPSFPSLGTLRGPEVSSTPQIPQASAELYVDATTGSDSNDGSEAHPFLSLKMAQKAAQQLHQKDRYHSFVTVFLRAGTFYLGADGPLVLTGADNKTTFAAYPGETAVVSGGTLLSDLAWSQKTSPAGVVWQAAVPKGVVFNSLFVDGKRAIRARFPNGDPVIPGDGFTLSGKNMGEPSTGDGGRKKYDNNVVVQVRSFVAFPPFFFSCLSLPHLPFPSPSLSLPFYFLCISFSFPFYLFRSVSFYFVSCSSLLFSSLSSSPLFSSLLFSSELNFPAPTPAHLKTACVACSAC